MIRWARRSDPLLPFPAGTLADWQAEWKKRWHPPADRSVWREVIVKALSSFGQVDRCLARLEARTPRPRPGSRLILLVAHRVEPPPPAARTFDLRKAGWLVELPHLCDPLPGDARGTAAWRERERIWTGASGETVIGMVLSRKISAAEAESAELVTVRRDPEEDYFPAQASGAPPLPELLLAGRSFAASELAMAYGLSLVDSLPLLDELLASGLLALLEPADSR